MRLYVCLCVSVCEWVCLCVWVRVCECVCMYVCVYVYVCVCMYVWMYLCMYMFVCMYVCVCVCMFVLCVCMYLCMCICIHVRMCMYKCVYVWKEGGGMMRVLGSHRVFVNWLSHVLKLWGLKHRPMRRHALPYRENCRPVILQPCICHPLRHSLPFHSQICLQRRATSVR